MTKRVFLIQIGLQYELSKSFMLALRVPYIAGVLPECTITKHNSRFGPNTQFCPYKIKANKANKNENKFHPIGYIKCMSFCVVMYVYLNLNHYFLFLSLHVQKM